MSANTAHSATIEITVNGETQRVAAAPLRDALCEIGYDPEQQGIAVALNLTVVPRAEWSAVRVGAGDQLDIIGAKQGG